jgi:phage tail sheath protein FI
MALNLNDLRTPGVYIDEVSLLPPSVAGVQTGIPAFVGHTEKAQRADGDTLLMKPTRIASMRDYELYFGGPQAEGASLCVVVYEEKVTRLKQDATTEEVLVNQYFKADLTKNRETGNNSPEPSAFNMFYSLQLYFANQGGPCYIVSVGNYNDSPSDKKGRLLKGLEKLENEDEPTLLVCPEAITLPIADCLGIYDQALKQANKLQDRFVIMDLKIDGKPSVDTDVEFTKAVTDFRDKLTLNNLKYGAAYCPYLESTIDFNYGNPDTSDVKLKYIKILDGVPQAIEEGFNVDGTTSITTLKDLKPRNSNLFEKCRTALSNLAILLPPSPAMAGIYAQVDRDRGVWKAPANVSVAAVSGPAVKINDEGQKTLNIDDNTGKSINAIRSMVGKGTLVWGARTLAGNDNEWRYIPVRRFFNFVEESVKKSTFQFVFEPNDANTWVKVRGMIENFLTLQWRQGALQGAKPEQAFYVRVGLGSTMTAIDINEGRMIVEIGMAVVRPAEFIILRFSHKMVEA